MGDIITQKSVMKQEIVEEDPFHTMLDENPWYLKNAELFLKYCCPECEYNVKELQLFSRHAIENHFESPIFFKNNNEAISQEIDSKKVIDEKLKLKSEVENVKFKINVVSDGVLVKSDILSSKHLKALTSTGRKASIGQGKV